MPFGTVVPNRVVRGTACKPCASRQNKLHARRRVTPLPPAISAGMCIASSHATSARRTPPFYHAEVNTMNGIIYLVGLVVVILAILSFLGLR